MELSMRENELLIMFGSERRLDTHKRYSLYERCDVEQRRKHMNKEMTVNGKSYTIIKLLGKGKGGYSYLAESGNNRYVLKQIHHEPCDYYQFGNKLEAEIRDYKKLKEIGIKMPAMLETDVKNERILKEFIDGDTIYQLICCSKQ